MRKTVIALLVTLGLTSTAKAGMPLTIGAGSAGYGATATDKGAFFTHWWAGLNVLPVTDYTSVYACYQNIGQNGGLNSDGVKVVLISGSADRVKGFYLMADLGVAMDLAANADGETVAAFTTGGGAALALTEFISPFIYASAYDSGARFKWAVHCGLAITDIQKIAGLNF